MQDRAKAANYISELATQLAQIARDHQFPTAAYILDVAALDAAEQAGLPGVARNGNHVAKAA